MNKKCGLALCLCVWAWMVQAATVHAVVGRVQIERDGRADPVAAQQSLRAGDMIITQAGGSLVLRLDDGALLLVRERSRVQLQSLGSPVTDQATQAVRISVGALRFVTGLIGKQRPTAVQLVTPTATVGIRGTDFDLVVRDLAQADLQAGTYVKVNSGGIQLNTGNEQLDVDAAQAVFAGEPVVSRGGIRQATTRRIAATAAVFQRSTLDELLPR